MSVHARTRSALTVVATCPTIVNKSDAFVHLGANGDRAMNASGTEAMVRTGSSGGAARGSSSDGGAVRSRRRTGSAQPKLEARSLADQLRRSIVDCRYPPGSRFPPEPEFARELNVSRSKLRDALDLLNAEHLVVRKPRVGTTVVSGRLVELSLHQNYGVQDMLGASGRTHGVRDASIEFTECTPTVAEHLNIKPGALVTVLSRVRTADGEPVMFTQDYLELQLTERAAAPLSPNVVLYRWLNDHMGISVAYGVAEITAVNASRALSDRLALPVGSAIMQIKQIDYTRDGTPILYSEEYSNPSAFVTRITREGPYS